MKKIFYTFVAILFATIMLNGCSGKQTATSTETIQTSVDTLTKCDKFLKDYEEFVNKSIVVIDKYKKDPSDLSSLKEYENMMGNASTMEINAKECSDPKNLKKVTELGEKLAKKLSEL